jgi:hypothetical protein
VRHLILTIPLLLATTPAFGAPEAAALSQARTAFGLCLQQRIVAASSNASPEAIVDTAFAECRTEQLQLRQAVVAGAGRSSGTSEAALRQFDEALAASRSNVIRYVSGFRMAPDGASPALKR